MSKQNERFVCIKMNYDHPLIPLKGAIIRTGEPNARVLVESGAAEYSTKSKWKKTGRITLP